MTPAEAARAAAGEIGRLVRGIQARRGRLDVCGEAALAAGTVLPDSVPEHGVYDGPDAARAGDAPYFHFWRRLRDGAILDPSANQFGDAEPVRVVDPDDPRQRWYLSETTDGRGGIVYRHVPFGPAHWAAAAFRNMDAIARAGRADPSADDERAGLGGGILER